MESEFTISRNDNAGEIIEKIEGALEEFDLIIEATEYTNDYISYRIKYKS